MNTNMVKQLYCNEIHSKNIEIYLSELYIGKYSEVNDVISTRKTSHLLTVLTVGALLIISRVQVAVL